MWSIKITFLNQQLTAFSGAFRENMGFGPLSQIYIVPKIRAGVSLLGFSTLGER